MVRVTANWSDRLAPTGDGERVAINDLSFKPDGSQLILAAGMRVLMYDANNGELIHSLRGHTDTVYSVCWSEDGKFFASGGADKRVFIWDYRGEGKLKFPHADAIQVVTYSPVTDQLLSLTATDFGLCSSPQRAVNKFKIPAKGLSAAWTSDGQHFAVGMFNGAISIRAKTGEEKATIRRNAPVWTLAWNPMKEDAADVLCVGSWDQRLSLYHISGQQIGKDRELTFDPCSICYYQNGAYMLVGGSDKKVSLYTKDGTFLTQVAEGNDWVWGVRQRPKTNNAIAMCTNDGVVSNFTLVFSTIHSIYQEQYVYRDNMTDVVIQLLTFDKKVRIHCRDYVRRVAIYRDRLAVQLQDRVVVYELYYDDQYELKYRLKERINKKIDCNLLCVTASNIVVCQDRRITSFDFTGEKKREWVLEAVVRYIKVVGGLPDREVLLVGLRNGAVLKIFLDNAFPVLLLRMPVAIRCLDLSASRMRLAVVDDNLNLSAYYLKDAGADLLFQETGVTAVAWNTDYEDMLCYSANGNLYVKTGLLPPYSQKLQGLVVGFKANKIFCLYYSTMSTIDVPHSYALHRCIEQKDFVKAHEVACLGVTEDDWRMLGMQAMLHLALEPARKAFMRIRDIKYVELLNRVELDRKIAGGDDSFLLGDIMAFQGKYREAAQCFLNAGLDARAIEMYCDLTMWEEAKQVCSSEEHMRDLVRRQARWVEESGDTFEAAKLCMSAGDYKRAIALMRDKGLAAVPQLLEICRALQPQTNRAAIVECGRFFRECGQIDHALEAFGRIDDHREIVRLRVEQGDWNEALRLLPLCPELGPEVQVAYAGWLAMNDRYEEAQDAFKRARRPQEALRMMGQLALNCVRTRKFEEAAFYYFKLADDTQTFQEDEDASVGGNALYDDKDLLEESSKQLGGSRSGTIATTGGTTDLLTDAATARLAALIKQHRKFFRKAEMYYVYDCIYHYVSQPFTPTDPKTLFYAARYLLTVTSDGTEVPQDLSKVNILLALARLTTQLQMLRLARQVHERLKQYVVPAHMAEQLEVATLVLRGRPYHDRDELLSTCPRCGQTNPSLPADGGDCCTNCLMPFVRCWASFELLPLVEFTLESGLSDAEAIAALNTGHGPRADEADTFSTAPGGKRGPQSLKKAAADQGAPADVMTFTNDDLVDVAMGLSGNAMGRVIDPFSRQTLQLEISRQESGVKKKQYTPITVGAENLRRLRRDDVFIVHRGWGLPNLYFRNMQPRVAVTLCVSCNHFFKSEDFEFACLRRSGGCPFCRAKAVDAQARVAERIKQQKSTNLGAVKAALGGMSPLRR